MTPPTQEESTEVVLELFDELLSLLAICEKTGGMGQAEAHRLYKHYAKMTSRFAAQGEVTQSPKYGVTSAPKSPDHPSMG